MLALVLCSGCAGLGGRASLPAVGAAHGRPAGGPWAAPTNSQLQQLLNAELKRLGKSPSDVTPHAPAGATNAAFDLAATVIDPDGPPDGGGGGTLPPTGIALTWTERLIGDYNLDGQVNVQDLAPLGINWELTVAYDSPTSHGGVAYWPTGDPLDDGGSVYPDPPATTSGAANWRRARVDGKEDGVLDVKDVTPIAVHWGEESMGYRVYAKLPGETTFHVLPNPDDAASPLTIPRSKLFPPGHTQVDSTRPACFNFTYGDSVTALPDGRYEFYTAAYDAATDADGPASAHVALDVTGGNVNQFPVAKLSLSPDFAGAPAVITLDASLSHDPDGSIVEYKWDFDGSGSTDWSTADPVPDSVCGGEVDTITPCAGTPPATVTVTYHQGHANYLIPHVTVVDDKAAQVTASAKLGVSGWVSELLNESETNYKLLFEPTEMSVDPTTNEVVVTGTAIDYSYNNMVATGSYFARRSADGTWSTQLLYKAQEEGAMTITAAVKDIAWDEHGKPILLMNYAVTGMTSTSRKEVWTAQPDAGGTFVITPRYFASLPEDQAVGSSAGGLITYGEGLMVAGLGETLKDKSSLSGNPTHNRSDVLLYDHGVWSVEYTGYDNAEREEMLMGVDNICTAQGSFHTLFASFAPLLNGAWWAAWQPGVGLGEPEKIPGTAGLITANTYPRYAAAASDGTMYLIYTNDLTVYKLLRIKPSGIVDCVDMAAVKPPNAADTPSAEQLSIIQGGAAFFVGYVTIPDPPWNSGVIYESWHWEGESWIRERMMTSVSGRPLSVACTAVDGQGHEYAVLERQWLVGDSPDRGAFNGRLVYLYARLDPRIGP
jgi:hypothetical protein